MQALTVRHKVPTSRRDRLARRHAPIRRNPQLELREERVRDPVCGEEDVFVLVQALRDEVAEGVVLFEEGEDGCVCDACCGLVSWC